MTIPTSRSLCSSICEKITLDNTSRPFFTTAAAVSSQELPNANINISSILYYFGGKKGIYTAALKKIVDTINEMPAELNSRYTEVIEKQDSKQARILLKEMSEYEDFKYVVFNLDNLLSIDSYSIKYIIN